MTTLTGDHGTARYGGEHWSVQHPVTATIAIMAFAIVCGALIGLLIDAAQNGPATASLHRGGGAHARASALVGVQDTVAAAVATQQTAAAAAGGHTVVAVKRSPARSGFATGRGVVRTGVPPATPQ